MQFCQLGNTYFSFSHLTEIDWLIGVELISNCFVVSEGKDRPTHKARVHDYLQRNSLIL